MMNRNVARKTVEDALGPLGLGKGELADNMTSTLAAGGMDSYFIERRRISILPGGRIMIEPLDPKHPQ
jgi:hypothetical protein